MVFYPGKLTSATGNEAFSEEELVVMEAVTIEGAQLCCRRCGQRAALKDYRLPNGAAYCPHCIGYGRLTTEMQLVYPRRPKGAPREVAFHWRGTRTVEQEKIAGKLAAQLDQGKTFLIHAVTGAGKTEMLFPVLLKALADGQHVCLSAPRIDVCRELLPRLQAVFPEEKIVFRYGEGETYEDCELLLCTTHQLLHFQAAFDLLIIDEIDAFPYEGDPRLAYAAKKALKPGGTRIFLSATPSQQLLNEIPSADILTLPARYHRRPLILPEPHFLPDWRKLPTSRRGLEKLALLIDELLQQNHLLLFCPSIAYMEQLYQGLMKVRPQLRGASVSSQDQQRAEKVLKMRQHHYQVLFCTTILERGVTFSQVSVVVLGADHPVYSKAALVQIAGRVDRKGAYQQGRVLFVFSQMTQEIRQGIQEIKALNALARKEGLLDEVSVMPRTESAGTHHS